MRRQWMTLKVNWESPMMWCTTWKRRSTRVAEMTPKIWMQFLLRLLAFFNFLKTVFRRYRLVPSLINQLKLLCWLKWKTFQLSNWLNQKVRPLPILVHNHGLWSWSSLIWEICSRSKVFVLNYKAMLIQVLSTVLSSIVSGTDCKLRETYHLTDRSYSYFRSRIISRDANSWKWILNLEMRGSLRWSSNTLNVSRSYRKS